MSEHDAKNMTSEAQAFRAGEAEGYHKGVKEAADRILYLEAGIRDLIEHHSREEDRERERVDALPVEDKIRERLIGKTKLRRAVWCRLQDLLDGNLLVPGRTSATGGGDHG